MPALFATSLLLALALAFAVAFSSEKSRGPFKWLLLLALLFAWVTLGMAVLVTALGWLALKATRRRGRTEPEHHQAPPE